jgi:nitroreductase/NAD-dependent dihydropyrimidine dehydrogenase PreA subunit
MPSLIVDESRCTRDGICLSECPGQFIELRDDSRVPTWIAGTEGRCISCGHCVAMCPQGALSLSTMSVELCAPVQRDLRLSAEQVEHHLRARRSVREYQNKPVPRDVLARLIDTARFAPSAGNRQSVQWLVVYDGLEVKKLAGHTVDWVNTFISQLDRLDLLRRAVEFCDAGEDIMIAGNAPHLVFTFAPKANEWDRIHCAIALTYLELSAPAFGLGTCWGGILTLAANEWPPMRQALGLSDAQACHGAMMIGYPRQEPRRIPLRNEAKVTWL